MMKTARVESRRFIVSSFIFVIFLCVFAFINQVRFDSLLRFSRCALSNTPSHYSSFSDSLPVNSSTNDEEIRVLLGILTLPDHYSRRYFLRLVYGIQSVIGAKVDVKFVFCNLLLQHAADLQRLGRWWGRPAIPLRDDDTYFRLQSLVDSLRPLPREDLYYGFVIPCRSMDPFVHYMSGMGYLVSWDIAEWIRTSDITNNNKEGHEDLLFGDWMRDGHRAKNRYNAKWAMYNFPYPHTACAHEFKPETIAVHLLKKQEKWIQTLQYFNVTKDLKPSKLYHIP